MDTNTKTIAWLAGITVASAALYDAARRLGDLLTHVVKFELIAILLFCLSLAAFGIVRRARVWDKRLAVLIVGAALAFRLIMAAAPPTLSDDIYRYAWDGRVQLAGLSPYTHTPNDPNLKHLRLANAGQLDYNGTSIAVYQPAAQILFFAAAPAGANSIYVIKGVLALLDIGTILFVLGILKLLRRRRDLVILYAWSPLIVFEIAGSGHIDGLAAFCAAASLYLAIRGAKYAAGALGGLALATKLYPGVILAAITARRRDVKPLAGAAVAAAAVYVPYMIWGGSVILVGGTIANASIAGGASFNQGLKAAVVWLCGGAGPAVDNAYALLAAAAIVSLAGYYWTKNKTPAGMVRAAFWLTAALLILLPYTVPWYFALALPFAIVEESWALVYLSGTVMLAYLFYAGSPWGLPAWVQPLEYVPFFALLLADLKRRPPGQLDLELPVNDAEL